MPWFHAHRLQHKNSNTTPGPGFMHTNGSALSKHKPVDNAGTK